MVNTTAERSQITLIEELSINAWPSLQTAIVDGWVLRFAEGYTRRANSVNPLYPSHEDVNTKIAQCESIYSTRGMDPVFKMTPLVYPAHLDTLLERQGYQEVSPTLVQTASLAGLNPLILTGRDTQVVFQNTVNERWLSAASRFNHLNDRYRGVLARMMTSIVPRRCFMSVLHNGHTAAVGLGVLERGMIGLFDIVVDESLRKKGFGRLLTHSLMMWGREHSAHTAYLQVTQTNIPALRLYSSLGFRENYQYWYRVRQQ